MRLRLAILLCLVLAGCHPGLTQLTATPLAGHAYATVQTERIEGANRLLTIIIHDLPPPTSFGDGVQGYSVNFRHFGNELVGSRPTEVVDHGEVAYDAARREGRLSLTTDKCWGDLYVDVIDSEHPNASPSVLFHQTLECD